MNGFVYRGVREAITAERWRFHGWPDDQAETLASINDDEVEARVYVTDATTGEESELPHHARHSPGGFDWGYRGLGPQDLALAMLLHHFACDTRGKWSDVVIDRNGGETRLPVDYMRFKDDVIERLPTKGFEITTAEIAAWVAGVAEVAA